MNFVFFYVTVSSTSVLRILSLVGLVLVVVPAILGLVKVDLLAMVPRNDLAVPEVAEQLVRAEAVASQARAWVAWQSEHQPGLLRVYVGLVALLAFFVGGAVSGWTLCFVLLNAIVLAPAAVHHKVVAAAHAQLGPVACKVSKTVTSALEPVKAFIKSKTGGGAPATTERPKAD